MKRSVMISLGLLTVISGSLLWWQTSNQSPHNVAITYNDFSFEITTSARDVSELLINQFGGYTDWTVQPAPETRLADGMTITVRDETASQLNPIVAANLASEERRYEEEKRANEPKSPIYTGTATWYRYKGILATASRRFPKGTTLRVIAINSGKTVDVVVNDYGPQAWTGVELDLDAVAFERLAPLGAGKIQIKYFKI